MNRKIYLVVLRPSPTSPQTGPVVRDQLLIIFRTIGPGIWEEIANINAFRQIVNYRRV